MGGQPDEDPNVELFFFSVMCPTCHKTFPLSVIEDHADICCDMATRSNELAYENLMLTIQRDDEPPDDMPNSPTQATQEEKSDLKDILERIAGRVCKRSSSISIQRKLILDDYIDARKRPWVKPENSLHIYFVGECAVDDGGPKREFLTGEGTISGPAFLLILKNGFACWI